MIREPYTVGRQPCADFKPMDDLFDGSGNVHDCFAPFDGSRPKCGEGESGGRVSFCTNCNRDHHSGGYETCLACRKATP